VKNYSAVELKKKVGQALSMTRVQEQETGKRRELEYQMRKEMETVLWMVYQMWTEEVLEGYTMSLSDKAGYGLTCRRRGFGLLCCRSRFTRGGRGF
jgi:hypothetical protein